MTFERFLLTSLLSTQTLASSLDSRRIGRCGGMDGTASTACVEDTSPLQLTVCFFRFSRSSTMSRGCYWRGLRLCLARVSVEVRAVFETCAGGSV